jgi:hypothetical protein
MVKGYIDSGKHEMVDKFVGTLKEFKHDNQKAGDGLYANLHAKRQRIAAGSGERMRKPGEAGAPTAGQFKQAAKTAKAEYGMMMPAMSTMKQKAADGVKIVPPAKRKPIVVTNPNDSRLKAYQDSSNVHDLQKHEIANWNKLVKMTPAQRNAFYEKEHIANATDPKQLRYNQRTSTYNLNLKDKDLNMLNTNQYIDSPGIRHHRPLPFPAPQQPVVLKEPIRKKPSSPKSGGSTEPVEKPKPVLVKPKIDVPKSTPKPIVSPMVKKGTEIKVVQEGNRKPVEKPKPIEKEIVSADTIPARVITPPDTTPTKPVTPEKVTPADTTATEKKTTPVEKPTPKKMPKAIMPTRQGGWSKQPLLMRLFPKLYKK